MRNNNETPLYILALNTGSREEDELTFVRAFGMQPRHVIGRYQGEDEDSYILSASHATREHVLTIAKEYGQEGVLYLDNQRSAWLLYTDNQEDEYIGEFVSTSKENAEKQDAYTKVEHKYYVVRS